jgi:ribonuclease Y
MSFLSNLVNHIFGGVKKDKVPSPTRYQEPSPSKPHLRESQIPSPAVSDAQTKAREIVIEAKDEALRIKHQAEDEARKIRQDALSLEGRLAQKEESIDRKLADIDARGRKLDERQHELESLKAELEQIKQEQIAKLERAAGLTRDEAKKLILEAVEGKLKEEVAKQIKEAETTAHEEADKKAKQILVDAMLHGVTDYVPEYTVSTIKLPDEEMKGRIIGKEGRNIRALELSTGVDIDLDETPGEIRLSSFDPVRREIARVALEKLIADGRIQPARIEEIVARTKKDIEKIMFEEGEKLCHAVGVYNMPVDLVIILGRYKYRFSYGQNLIAHTLEETKIGVKLAHEVNADVNIVRLGCLLHDIGKVVTEEEGSHVKLGADLLRKYGMPEAVIACLEEHHGDKPFSSIESTLIYVADAISGSRPGARYEDYEEYVKRLKDLELLAKSFKGVEDAYAFQAGREVRVIVNPEQVDDATAITISHDLKNKIEDQIKNYPGQIKVTVIRELRATDTAK